jgi:hypothetical protein
MNIDEIIMKESQDSNVRHATSYVSTGNKGQWVKSFRRKQVKTDNEIIRSEIKILLDNNYKKENIWSFLVNQKHLATSEETVKEIIKTLSPRSKN